MQSSLFTKMESRLRSLPVVERAATEAKRLPPRRRWLLIVGATVAVVALVAGIATGMSLAGRQTTLLRATATTDTTWATLPLAATSIVLNGRVLLRHASDGAWQDVTPKITVRKDDLLDAQFLDEHTGWVAVAQRYERAKDSVAVYHTTDGGANWTGVALSDFGPFQTGLLRSSFVSATVGWVLVSLSETTSNRPGALFTTSDGGATWTRLTVPTGGAIQFINDKSGWLIGGRVNYVRNQVFMTRDGGRTWIEQPLLLPGGHENANVMIGVPVFFTPRDGLLPVNLEQLTVVYSTHDGGRSWVNTSSFADDPANFKLLPLASAVGKDGVIALGNQLFVTHDGGQGWAALAHGGDLTRAQSLGLANAKSGWAIIANGYCASQFVLRCNSTTLLTTSDGGATWAQGA